jgi:diaminohydroxyphosphoribosylaminopyrimidine deaminase/5-amino-6-(5-phosphoribosylamino)uracil reductase
MIAQGDFSAVDRGHMAEALALAEKGLWTTSPNPRVGCVIVNDGEVIGRGWHEKAGGPHAEVHALREAGARAAGATVYVTLEPCNHHGRTPPCSDALVAARPARVVAAMQDPNPQVAGTGFAKLRAAGIAVESGLMQDEAAELNIGFIARMTRGRPWLRMKIAATLDGRTALANGQSQWITGAEARRDGHAWRARACALLTGIGTVRDDDPQLTVRDVATTRQPLRVVVDSKLQIAPTARILEGGGLLVVSAIDDREKIKALADRGAEVVVLANPQGKTDLEAIMRELARRGINEVHAESGSKLNGSLIAAGVVDELLLYYAPSLLGDAARGMFNLPEFTSLDQKIELRFHDVRKVGDDLRVLARL